MEDLPPKLFSDQEKESWKKFSEQRKKDLMSPDFPFLHHNSYDQMSWFQFLQYKWSLSSQNSNPFNMDDGLEYALRVHNFGPDIRQISDFYSPSYYLNKINQTSSQQSSIIKSAAPRPSFYGKGSQFGLACYKKYDNVFTPNCPKKSDSKFNSPFSYYADRRLKVIENEKPSIKKSLLLPEIVHEWESFTENSKGQIRNIWKNYLAIHHQLYQQGKEDKNTQVALKLKNTTESENDNNNVNANTNENSTINNSEPSSVIQNKDQLYNELRKNQEDLDKAIDDALKEIVV